MYFYGCHKNFLNFFEIEQFDFRHMKLASSKFERLEGISLFLGPNETDVFVRPVEYQLDSNGRYMDTTSSINIAIYKTISYLKINYLISNT